jgi:ABC-type sugar transport system ATPase subunit
MAGVRLEGIVKTYPNGHAAVRGLDLAIEDGEFMVLVGPSGCGKSTVLRMIAGLETPTGGRLVIGDRDAPRCRRRSATSRWCSRATPSTRT